VVAVPSSHRDAATIPLVPMGGKLLVPPARHLINAAARRAES
jgi:hypothetical protein